MPIVTQCTADGCETLTMGPLCIEHEAPTTRVFVRGRPWTRVTTAPARTAGIPAVAATSTVRPVRTASEPLVAAQRLP